MVHQQNDKKKTFLGTLYDWQVTNYLLVLVLFGGMLWVKNHGGFKEVPKYLPLQCQETFNGEDGKPHTVSLAACPIERENGGIVLFGNEEKLESGDLVILAHYKKNLVGPLLQTGAYTHVDADFVAIDKTTNKIVHTEKLTTRKTNIATFSSRYADLAPPLELQRIAMIPNCRYEFRINEVFVCNQPYDSTNIGDQIRKKKLLMSLTIHNTKLTLQDRLMPLRNIAEIAVLISTVVFLLVRLARGVLISGKSVVGLLLAALALPDLLWPLWSSTAPTQKEMFITLIFQITALELVAHLFFLYVLLGRWGSRTLTSLNGFLGMCFLAYHIHVAINRLLGSEDLADLRYPYLLPHQRHNDIYVQFHYKMHLGVEVMIIGIVMAGLSALRPTCRSYTTSLGLLVGYIFVIQTIIRADLFTLLEYNPYRLVMQTLLPALLVLVYQVILGSKEDLITTAPHSSPDKTEE